MHDNSLPEFFDRAGFVAYPVVGATIVAGVVSSLCLWFTGSGSARVPSGLGVALGLGPWLAGVFGTNLGATTTRRAIAFADVAEQKDLMAVGFSESLSTSALGAWCSSALLAGVALGSLVLLWPNGDRSRKGALLGVLLGALPLAALVLSAADLVVALLAAAGVFAALTGLVGLRTGVTNRRAFLGAASVLAGVLSLVALATALRSISLSEALLALPLAWKKTALAIELAPRLASLQAAGQVLGLFGTLATAWIGLRAAWLVRPTVPQLLGMGTLLMASLVPLGYQARSEAEMIEYASTLPVAPWRMHQGFIPIHTNGRAEAPAFRQDVVVTRDKLIAPHGTIALEAIDSVEARQRLRSIFRQSLESRRAGDANPFEEPQMPRRRATIASTQSRQLRSIFQGASPLPISAGADDDNEIAERREPHMGWLVDRSVSGVHLRGLLEEAASAGVNSIVFLGVDEDVEAPPSSTMKQAPLLTVLAEPRQRMSQVLLDRSTPVRSAALKGTVFSDRLEVILAGAVLEGKTVRLTIGDSAEAQHVVQAVDDLARQKARPRLVVGGTDTP
ncbi:MAG: hypothetical protein H6729_11875 [Deltaproteobacteria bacterium]|nr:hypothetical protein [Deltaproteobacteria bacterium]